MAAKNVGTKLYGKEASPLTVRKYTTIGVPVFVALITDDSLHDLDEVVLPVLEKFRQEFREKKPTLQDFRVLADEIVQVLRDKYVRSEGIACLIFPDKAAVASLWGDFMNHLHCRMELYFLVQTMWFL